MNELDKFFLFDSCEGVNIPCPLIPKSNPAIQPSVIHQLVGRIFFEEQHHFKESISETNGLKTFLFWVMNSGTVAYMQESRNMSLDICIYIYTVYIEMF